MSTPTGEQGKRHDKLGHMAVRVRYAFLPWFFAVGAALSACTDKDSINKQVLPGTITSKSQTTGAVRGVPIHLLAAYETREKKDEARVLEQKLNATISPGGKVSPRFTASMDSKGIRPYEVTVDEIIGDGPYEVKSTIQECVKDTSNCGPVVELTWKFVMDTTAPEFTDVTVSTETGMFHGAGKTVDKTTNVRDISGSTCGAEKKPIPLKIGEDGTYSFSLPASVGDNCVDITVTDQVGNTSTKKLSSKYQFDVGFTAKPIIKGDKATISGTLPKSANPTTLKASGKQNQWRHLGIEGDVTCGQSAIDGTHYKIECQLPSSTGGPAQIHVTFEDINGKKFDLYYQDKSNLFLNIPDPTNLDYFAWWGMIAAQVLASVLVTGSGIGLDIFAYRWIDNKNRKNRGEKYSSSNISDRSSLLREYSRDSRNLFGMSPAERAVYDQVESAHRSAKAGLLTVALQNILNMDVSGVKSLAYLKQIALGELVVEAIDRLERIEKNPSIEALKSEETAFLLQTVKNILNTNTGCRKLMGHDQVTRARRCMGTLQVARDSYSLSSSELEKNYAYLWNEAAPKAAERLCTTVRGLFKIGNYTAAGIIIGHAKGGLREELTREYNNGVTHMLNYLIDRRDYKAALSGYDVLYKLSPELLPDQNEKVNELLSHIYNEFLALITKGDRSVFSDKGLKDLITAIRHSLELPWLRNEGVVTSNFKEAVAAQAHELYLVGLAEANSIELVTGEFAKAQQNPSGLFRTIDIFTRWKDLRTLAHVADNMTDVSAQGTIRAAVSTTEDSITEQFITALAKRDQLSARAAVSPYKLTKGFEAKVAQLVRTDVELQRAAEKVRKIYEHYGQDAEKDPRPLLVNIITGVNLEFWKLAYSLPPEKAHTFLLAIVAALKIPNTLMVGVNIFEFEDGILRIEGVAGAKQRDLRVLFHPDKALSIQNKPIREAMKYYYSTLSRRISELVDGDIGEVNPELLKKMDKKFVVKNSADFQITIDILSAFMRGFAIQKGESVAHTIRCILEKIML